MHTRTHSRVSTTDLSRRMGVPVAFTCRASLRKIEIFSMMFCMEVCTDGWSDQLLASYQQEDVLIGLTIVSHEFPCVLSRFYLYMKPSCVMHILTPANPLARTLYTACNIVAKHLEYWVASEMCTCLIDEIIYFCHCS